MRSWWWRAQTCAQYKKWSVFRGKNYNVHGIFRISSNIVAFLSGGNTIHLGGKTNNSIAKWIAKLIKVQEMLIESKNIGSMNQLIKQGYIKKGRKYDRSLSLSAYTRTKNIIEEFPRVRLEGTRCNTQVCNRWVAHCTNTRIKQNAHPLNPTPWFDCTI